MLTQSRLKEVLDYNSETGVFSWLSTRNGRAVEGEIAGRLHSGGYWRIDIDGYTYYAHRLAWLYVNGYFPENVIDHIDRNKLNNTIINLRESTTQCNIRNSKLNCNNVSGVNGVFKYRGGWQAKIKIERRGIYLGTHECFLEAVCHRLAAEQAVDWNGCDSSSSAYLFVKKNIRGLT